jgi:hypothetical protein
MDQGVFCIGCEVVTYWNITSCDFWLLGFLPQKHVLSPKSDTSKGEMAPWSHPFRSVFVELRTVFRQIFCRDFGIAPAVDSSEKYQDSFKKVWRRSIEFCLTEEAGQCLAGGGLWRLDFAWGRIIR